MMDLTNAGAHLAARFAAEPDPLVAALQAAGNHGRWTETEEPEEEEWDGVPQRAVDPYQGSGNAGPSTFGEDPLMGALREALGGF